MDVLTLQIQLVDLQQSLSMFTAGSRFAFEKKDAEKLEKLNKAFRIKREQIGQFQVITFKESGNENEKIITEMIMILVEINNLTEELVNKLDNKNSINQTRYEILTNSVNKIINLLSGFNHLEKAE